MSLLILGTMNRKKTIIITLFIKLALSYILLKKWTKTLVRHMFPKDLKILSLVKLLLYVIIFICCLYVYIRWNKIPKREFKIQTEVLKSSNSYRIKVADIGVFFPMSESLKNNKFGYLSVQFNACSNGLDSNEVNDDGLNKFEEEEIKKLVQKCDSIENYHNLSLKFDNLFYSSFIREKISSSEYVIKKEPIMKDGWNYHLFCETIESKNSIENKVWINSHNKRFGAFTIEQDGGSLAKPTWFRLEDISQAYYSFQLQTHSIDSLLLRFNFYGATEFSQMHPSPDEIGMNYILFRDQDKISKIKSSGIDFYVRFSDMENKQTVRMFAITTFLSMILTVFLTFLINVLSVIITKSKQH